MATIKKSLSAQKDGRGYSQILFRVSINKNQKLRLKTGIFIPERRWDAVKERMNYGKSVGMERIEMAEKETQLKQLETKVLRLCEMFPNDAITKDWVENVLSLCKNLDAASLTAASVSTLIERAQNPEQYASYSFFDLMADYRNNAKKRVNGKREGDKSEVWKRNFDVLVRALHRYEMFVRLTDRNRKDFALDIDTIDHETLEDIESYLRNEHSLLEEYPKVFDKFPATTDTKRRSPKPQPRGNNTIAALFNKLRAFFHWLNEKGITANDPFRGFEGTTSERYGTPYYITLEERNAIADFDLSERPALEAQRDIFIFQCCIGCRVSDLLRLTNENVVNGFVEYIPTKTKGERPKVVRVPLNARATSILHKWHGTAPGDKLLPFISAQKYNNAIKGIFTVCGITRLVTILDSVTGQEVQRPINEVASSHMARRCFVGNIYKQVKDPNLIAPLSGHSEGSRAFARYREIDDEMKKEIVKLIE